MVRPWVITGLISTMLAFAIALEIALAVSNNRQGLCLHSYCLILFLTEFMIGFGVDQNNIFPVSASVLTVSSHTVTPPLGSFTELTFTITTCPVFLSHLDYHASCSSVEGYTSCGVVLAGKHMVVVTLGASRNDYCTAVCHAFKRQQSGGRHGITRLRTRSIHIRFPDVPLTHWSLVVY